MDLNKAEKQIIPESVIPDGTIVPVQVTVRPGGAGDGGWLKHSKDGTCLMLDVEFTVIEGKYARRKFWTLLTVEGETEGHQKAADISRSRLRAFLEGAHGINPSDESERAAACRLVSSYQGFDNLRMWVVVGLEKGKNGYKDKNFLKAVVTPDKKEWSKLDQVADVASPVVAKPFVKPEGSNVSSGGRPSWAQN
jgi:hypothetical protein